MNFEFELKPVEEIDPWGEYPNQSLHWFGLTDGKYRIKIGDEYLLNYSEKFTEYCIGKFPESSFDTTFVEYQVVRIWEDILELLPDILKCESLEIKNYVDACYLSNPPNIWFCADRENVDICWDNRKIKVENIPVWSATSGTHRMSKKQFIKIVQKFDESLIAEMSQRIDTICGNWKMFQDTVDCGELKAEQIDRASWLGMILNTSSLRKYVTEA